MEGFQRRPDGTEAAGWRNAAVLHDNLVQFLCGPVVLRPTASGVFRSYIL